MGLRIGGVMLGLNEDRAVSRAGFSLIELLVAIGIVGVLLAILLPVLSKVRQQATAVRCAANLQQVGQAFTAYLIDSRQLAFWRGQDINTEGMDWYVHGGQETGNGHVGQGGLFNRFQPRPLNPYVGGNLEVFRCPSDTDVAAWVPTGLSHFEWVGTSYLFNAVGTPGTPTRPDRGLSGVRFSRLRDTARLILFAETGFMYRAQWHARGKVNVCLADGHVAYVDLPAAVASGEMRWW
jgi:prepilin-type N-terminal cleavage/methylation domain-containing protein/prepilin-type processing-associated H-X9-DG protein